MKVLVIGDIGGLATAFSLHAVGIECEVFEQSRGIRELGVGINTLRRTINELAEGDLLDVLDRVAIRTAELIYTNRLGQELWREPRGSMPAMTIRSCPSIVGNCKGCSMKRPGHGSAGAGTISTPPIGCAMSRKTGRSQLATQRLAGCEFSLRGRAYGG